MAGFSDIIGQEHIKEHLQSSLRANKISHAYMISGEVSSGKEFIANIFAAALQCEEPKEDGSPCFECHSCKQAISKNHPDIITVGHLKPNTISVEDIREQIVNDIGIKPYNGKYKIYIVNEAEKMTVQAQNALLKSLEEPPEYVVMMLLTTNMQMMLSTITSRCVLLNMRPVDDSIVRQYLMKEVKIPDYQADICVAFARGNIGKAKKLATSDDFDNLREEAIRILKNIKRMDTSDMMDALKKLSEYKLSIDDFLDIMTVWYRDVLMYKATMDTDAIVFKEEDSDIQKCALQSTYEGIDNTISLIQKTKTRLKANVSFDLALELLLLTIKEN